MKDKLDRLTNIAIILACVLVSALAVQRLWIPEARGTSSADQSAVEDVRRGDIVIQTTGAPRLGHQGARLVLIEFSDFECPFCGRHARDVFPRIKQKYVDSGRLGYVFRNLPLPNHPFAVQAATAAGCALKQGRYWEMHNRLFADQKSLTIPHLEKHALELNLRRDTFASCLKGGPDEQIKADLVEAARLGISATPTFFAGLEQDGKMTVLKQLKGAQPYAVFEKMLNELLPATQSTKAL